MATSQVKNVIFGAGYYGRQALNLVQNVVFFVDNDINKAGSNIEGLPIRHFQEALSEMKDYRIVIAIHSKYIDEIKNQLLNAGITNFVTFQQLWKIKVKADIEGRKDFIGVYHKALNWIDNHTLQEKYGKAIICETNLPKGYPEVSGYYIPTLIRIGKRKLALDYATWLISIQKEDGSWYDTLDEAPYVFDTGQILKGLLAVRDICEEKRSIDIAIKRGCDWILDQMQEDGRLITPDESTVGNNRMCSEAIHLYCLKPLFEVAEILSDQKYAIAAEKIKSYYMKYHYGDIINWHILTHFYAYIMEALLDVGEEDLVRKCMDKLVEHQSENGMVSAYPDVNWVCSTGLFQLAMVWFRLGDSEQGNKAFEAAISLQNSSGGWYGSYNIDDKSKEDNDYFPTGEISWAVKYFFDALYWKNVMDFNDSSPQFDENIAKNDGRYKILKESIKTSGGSILDVGCGKGRYLINLVKDAPHNVYFGVDIATSGMQLIQDSNIHLKQGTLTNIPYEQNTFDIVFTCEALEHAIDTRGAIRELARVTKPGGMLIIIDKSRSALGELKITPWEQWFDETELQTIMKEYCSEVKVYTRVPYEDIEDSNLFSVWSGIVS